MTERIRAELAVWKYSWKFCLIDFTVMAEDLPDFKSADDFDGSPYSFAPSIRMIGFYNFSVFLHIISGGRSCQPNGTFPLTPKRKAQSMCVFKCTHPHQPRTQKSKPRRSTEFDSQTIRLQKEIWLYTARSKWKVREMLCMLLSRHLHYWFKPVSDENKNF